ncbi:tyrosine-type recombinase/integrase [Parashewanella spongiae]|nr:tyrosine-type recombinase/integrase [Parashewanella spongiae]
MIELLDGFWLYLNNSRIEQAKNVYSLKASPYDVPTEAYSTNAAHYHSVCRFIEQLISNYISPHYITKAPDEVELCRRNILALLSQKKKQYSSYSSDKHKNDYKSLNENQFRDFVSVFPVPTNPTKDGLGKVSNSVYRQYRDHILLRFLSSYGLRIGEALLLRGSSFKPNFSETKFFMMVTNLEDNVDPRSKKPSIKTASSHRELEISQQDYMIVKGFMSQVKLISQHDFLFTSSSTNASPLSYQGARKIIIDASNRMKKLFPHHFDITKSDHLQTISPHMLRHTWAYFQLEHIFRRYTADFIKAGAVDPKGIMKSAIDHLRSLGGWSARSQMPAYYGKRFIAKRANELSMSKFKEDAFKHFNIELPIFLRNIDESSIDK